MWSNEDEEEDGE
jgi:hypothetical protein